MTSRRKSSSTASTASIWEWVVSTGERRDITRSPNRPPTSRRLSRRISTPWRPAASASHEQRRQSGLDFQSASRRNVWSLTSFATLLAKLLGRDGGLSALSADELDALRAFHARHDRVHESLLRAAVASAESPTIPHVLFQLQSLLSQGDT